MTDLTIWIFLSEYSYSLNESSCVDAVVLVYSCFLFHLERIRDTCKIVHLWKCVWVTLPKPKKEFSSRTEGRGEGNDEQKVSFGQQILEEGKETAQRNSWQKGTIKIIYHVAAALALQMLLGAGRAPRLLGTGPWCQAGGARWATGCGPAGEASG